MIIFFKGHIFPYDVKTFLTSNFLKNKSNKWNRANNEWKSVCSRAMGVKEAFRLDQNIDKNKKATLWRNWRGRSLTWRGYVLIRRRAFNSIMPNSVVWMDPNHTRTRCIPYKRADSTFVYGYHLRGTNIRGDDKECPTWWKLIHIKDYIWRFQLRFWIRNRPRMLGVEDGDSWVLLKKWV